MAVLSRLVSGTAALLAIGSGAADGTLRRRGTVGSDDIVGLPQAVPNGTIGDVYLAFQPYLYVVNGCVPFPGVDADGNTNAGLKPTGPSDGDCSSSTGQIYVRGAAYGDFYALLYSWYMPKDEPSTGLGHRHDWEGTVVWLSNNSSTGADNIVAVCPSQHGNWDCSASDYSLSGTRPLIQYESFWPLDHAMFLSSTVGGTQPLVAWESLSAVVQNALDTTDFGSASVPFNEDHFTSNLAACSW